MKRILFACWMLVSTTTAFTASAHVNGGDYANSCSPHGANQSTGASNFFNCSHSSSSYYYPRDVACSLGSNCYNNGYSPNVGTCSLGFVQGHSTQDYRASGGTHHTLDPQWTLWTCDALRHKNASCGGGGSSFNFMCVSDSCDASTKKCVGTVANGGSCSNDDQCVGENYCYGGTCKLPDGEVCHLPGGAFSQCATSACTAWGGGVCKSSYTCYCGGYPAP